MSLRTSSAWISVVCCGLAVALSGCAKRGGPERAVVTGELSFEGQPISDGVIRFVPLDGPTAQGFIKDGKYKIDHKGGVPVGDARVEVEAYRDVTAADMNVGSAIPEFKAKVAAEARGTKQILPEKFNTNTILKFTVQSSSENDFSIDLRP